MPKVIVRLEGLRELQQVLRELPKATQKNVMVRVLKRRAEPIAQRARDLVPVRTGSLKESIIVSSRARNASAGKIAFAEAMAAGASRKEAGQAARAANRSDPLAGDAVVFVGSTNRKWSHMIEFGTSEMEAQPYLRPAFDQLKDQILVGIREDIRAEIDKAVQRLAKKRARAGR